VLTVPQAAATLAVTLIGFEIGLFGTHVVNAVLVLILVSIVVGAVVAERIVKSLPPREGHRPPLGAKVLVIAPSGGPSEAAVRAATLLARPDGGHSDVLITCTPEDGRPERAALRAVEHRLSRHGLDGHVRTDVSDIGDALARSLLTAEPSVVVVDDPAYDALPGGVPVLVVDGERAPRVIAADNDGVAEEIARRLR
jgi:hypothetical protein